MDEIKKIMTLAEYLKHAGLTPTSFAMMIKNPVTGKPVTKDAVIKWLNKSRRPGLDLISEMKTVTGGLIDVNSFIK